MIKYFGKKKHAENKIKSQGVFNVSYTIEQKEEAIRFYLNNGNDAKITCEKLGYPSYETLLGWVKNALGSSTPSRKIRYTPEQKAYAIKYYLENGNNASKTVRDIGYPSLSLFFRWLSEDVPNAIMKGNMVRYTEEQKKYAVEYYINCSRNIARTIEAIGYPTAGTLSKWIAKYSPVPKTNLVRKVNSSVALSNVKENLNATFVPQNIISIKQEKVIDLPADDPDDISISKRRTSVNNYQEVQEVKQEELRSEILYDRSISNYKALTGMLNFRASENFWTWRRVRDIIAELEAKNCSHISNLSSVTIGKILTEIAAKYKQVKSKTIRGCKWYFLPPLLDQETRENKSTRISQALRNEDLRHIEHIRMMKKQIQELNEELQHVRMEKDALEIAAQIIKKDMGISLDNYLITKRPL